MKENVIMNTQKKPKIIKKNIFKNNEQKLIKTKTKKKKSFSRENN